MNIVRYTFNDKYKQKVMDELTTIITNIKYQYPELKNSLSQEEIQIICDVIYEYCAKTNKVNQYLEIMTNLFCSSLYNAVGESMRFNWNLVKLNKFVLLPYFNILEIWKIIKIIENKMNKKIKCKVISFRKGGRTWKKDL